MGRVAVLLTGGQWVVDQRLMKGIQTGIAPTAACITQREDGKFVLTWDFSRYRSGRCTGMPAHRRVFPDLDQAKMAARMLV